MSWQTTLIAVLLLALVAGGCQAAPVATNLQAHYRNGQVFLTWDEPPGCQASFAVRISDHPITAANVGSARVVAAHINAGSAYDWWLNPETYGNPLPIDPKTGKKPPIPHEGFIITAGGARLNPDSGLHVHTVAPDEVGNRYYAVTSRDKNGDADLDIVAGANSLRQPVAEKCEPYQPIWQKAGQPKVAAGKGLPLHLILHAKCGRGGMEYLAFGDKSLGWREGLPFKFGVRVTADAVIVSPTDRTWIGRMFPEGLDECNRLTPAIHSFWYGYNSNIYDPKLMPQGVATNYTERRVLWIINWVKRTYQTDPNRTYAYGSSMGGCGDISFCLHHPEIFAAIRANVPIVTYAKGAGGNSEFRLRAECGPFDALCSEGMTLRDRLNGTKFVTETKGDLPFLVISNGRTDTSIPWWKNPAFYRAMRATRHAFIAAWNDGSHATCDAELPPDIKHWDNLNSFHFLALNKSYIAFSNSSADNNPGNGERDNGDIVGYMNRGLSYTEPVDQPERYETVIKCSLQPSVLPLTVDVTPRRLQAFKLQPGEPITAVNQDAATGKEVQRVTLKVDDLGLATFRQFKVTSPAGNRLLLTR